MAWAGMASHLRCWVSLWPVPQLHKRSGIGDHGGFPDPGEAVMLSQPPLYLETKGLPASTKRASRAASLVIPIRGVTRTSLAKKPSS